MNKHPVFTSTQQEKFLDNFLDTLDPCKAFIHAGGMAENKTELRRHAYAIMRIPWVRNEAKRRFNEVLVRFDITKEHILRELARIAFSNVQDLYYNDGTLKPISELTRDQAAAISSIEVEERLGLAGGEVVPKAHKKYKFYDKMRALEALAQYLQMETQQEKSVSEDPDTKIVVYIPENSR